MTPQANVNPRGQGTRGRTHLAAAGSHQRDGTRGDSARPSHRPTTASSTATSRVTSTPTKAYGGTPARAAMTRAVAPAGCPWTTAGQYSGTPQPIRAMARTAGTV